jgi:hypothetical protein
VNDYGSSNLVRIGHIVDAVVNENKVEGIIPVLGQIESIAAYKAQIPEF